MTQDEIEKYTRPITCYQFEFAGQPDAVELSIGNADMTEAEMRLLAKAVFEIVNAFEGRRGVKP